MNDSNKKNNDHSEKRATIVRELDKAMSQAYGGDTFEESLHLIAQQARLIVGAHQSALSYIPDQDFKVAVHTHSFSEKYEKYNDYDVMPTGKGIWRVALKKNKPVIMTQKELTSNPKWKNFSGLKTKSGLEHPPMRGWLAAPICRKSGGEVIGLLQLTDKYSGDFTEEDATLLSLFGNIAALVFELQYANQELTQFAHVASHDLKAPLNTIKSFMELVKKNNQDILDEKSINFIQRAIYNTDKMAGLLDSLLLYSRIHTKPSEVNSFDCNVLVEEVIESLGEGNKDQTHDFEIMFHNLPSITADRNQLSQVFSNLLSNAIKYCKKNTKTKIEIKAQEENNFIRFSITDNGIGIESEYFDQIFGIFQRLHTSLEYPGTGVGLALARRIIHRHGGRIWLDSTLGEGTTFYFTLPKKRSSKGVKHA